MKRLIIVTLLCMQLNATFSQGGIEHIKNMSYLKYAKNIDCNDRPGDELTNRICANLAYQKSDSLLVIIYEKLLKEATSQIEKEKIIQLQKNWRELRDKHCAILWESHGIPSSNHAAISILNCLTLLTNNRIRELELLLNENL